MVKYRRSTRSSVSFARRVHVWWHHSKRKIEKVIKWAEPIAWSRAADYLSRLDSIRVACLVAFVHGANEVTILVCKRHQF